MKSNLFKRLAALPGINWFNHKEKAEYTEEQHLPVIGQAESYFELLRKSEKYFSHIQSLKQYIKVLLTLVDEFDDEVIRWDRVRAQHEREVNEVKNSSSGRMKSLLQEREAQIKKLQNRVRDLENQKRPKPTISNEVVEKLIAHLERVDVPTSSKEKNEKKYRHMHQTLHNFLQKLQAHSPKELIQ